MPILSRACPPDGKGSGTPLSPLFLRECRRMTGEAAFRAGDLARSRATYQLLEKTADNEAERLRARDFLERISWEERRR